MVQFLQQVIPLILFVLELQVHGAKLGNELLRRLGRLFERILQDLVTGHFELHRPCILELQLRFLARVFHLPQLHFLLLDLLLPLRLLFLEVRRRKHVRLLLDRVVVSSCPIQRRLVFVDLLSQEAQLRLLALLILLEINQEHIILGGQVRHPSLS